MPEPTNLTDRISYLRDRKDRSPIVQGGEAPAPKKNPQKNKRRRPERKLANDYFMLFVYALLAIALVTQLGLIVWLDLI
jgi:nitrate reductase NapE component